MSKSNAGYDIQAFLENKSVLIMGFGREGKSTYNYIRKYMPDKKLTVCDKNTFPVMCLNC